MTIRIRVRNSSNSRTMSEQPKQDNAGEYKIQPVNPSPAEGQLGGCAARKRSPEAASEPVADATKARQPHITSAECAPPRTRLIVASIGQPLSKEELAKRTAELNKD